MKVRYSRIAFADPKMTSGVPTQIRERSIAKNNEKKKDIVPFNQRIAAAAKDKNLTYALDQWEKIHAAGMEPTAHTYCAMVNAYVRCGQLSQAEELVDTMSKTIGTRNVEGYLITLTALLKGYFMSSAFERSHNLFKRIIASTPSSSRVGSRTLDTYLRGCLRTGAIIEGLSAFESVRTEKSEMSKIYAAKMMATKLAVKSANDVGGENPDVFIHIASAYIRLGKIDRTREWFCRAREALYHTSPERQFDKLQRSESLMLCDFYTSTNHQVSPIQTDQYITRFLTTSQSVDTQVSIWNSLGLSKFMDEDAILSRAQNSLKSFHSIIQQYSTKSIIVEICSGSGEWICRAAESDRKNKLFIAVEFRFDRCVDILTRMSFLNLENLIIICGDARSINFLFPPNSVNEIHINYPEPPPVNSSNIDEEMSSDIVTKKFLTDCKSQLLKPKQSKIQIVSDNKLYINTVCNIVNEALNVEVFPKSSKTLVDSYFARFFSKKAKRYCIEAQIE